MKRIWQIGVSFCFMLLIFSINSVYAASDNAVKWQVPFLGIAEGPDGFKAVDLEEWSDKWSKVMDSQNGQTKENLKKSKKNQEQKKVKFPAGLKMLQLQVNDGNMYHVAFAMLIQDDKADQKGPSGFFSQPLTAEQETKLQELNDKISEGIKTAEEAVDKSGFMKVQILNVSPLAPMEDAKEVIYTLGGRYVADIGGVILPIYGKSYFLERDGKLIVAIIATSDTEREYWSDVSDKLFLSLEKNYSI